VETKFEMSFQTKSTTLPAGYLLAAILFELCPNRVCWYSFCDIQAVQHLKTIKFTVIMKKISLLVLLSMLSTAAFSQSFSIGPKAGVNISNYTGSDVESEALVGFHLGGILNFGIGEVFSIQPEVLFSTQGAKIDNGNQKTEFKTSYVSVPVMLKFRSRGGFYFEFGPQASFKTGEDVPDQTIDNFAKNLDLAGGVGVGYQAGFGLGIGARYIAGFSKVGDFDKTAAMNPDFRNSVIQLSVLFAIPARK
jgi:hypothetical protein